MTDNERGKTSLWTYAERVISVMAIIIGTLITWYVNDFKTSVKETNNSIKELTSSVNELKVQYATQNTMQESERKRVDKMEEDLRQEIKDLYDLNQWTIETFHGQKIPAKFKR